MKLILLLIGSSVCITWINPSQTTQWVESTQQTKSYFSFLELISDSSGWTAEFLELKKAITTGNRKAVKSFIDFPIKNKENEIWYLADSKLVMEISPKEIKPFTEADFEKYFSSIFALDLRKTLEKLNVEEFFSTNSSTSPEIEVVEDSKSKLEASYDNVKNRISLALITTLTGQTNTRFTIYYQFDVTNTGQIKFREVHME